jgi:hypothetical protein
MNNTSEGSYIYEIGYGSYEESDFTQLTHTKKFTGEEIKNLVHKVIKEILLSITIDNNGSSIFATVNHMSFSGYAEKDYKESKKLGGHKYKYHITFEDLHSVVVEKLIKDHGFKPMQFETCYSMFGWGGLFDTEWEQDEDLNLKGLREFIKNDVELQNKYKELIEKSIPHLLKDEKELKEEMAKDRGNNAK